MMPPSGRMFFAPQTLGAPPPPQSSPVGHVPPSGAQATTPPQPLAWTPQFIPAEHFVTGMHAAVPPQMLGVPPPPHVAGPEHDPQSLLPPHPSLTSPHGTPPSTPDAATIAAHADAFGIGVHAFRPPSMTAPSGSRSSAPQTLAAPPPPHVVPLGQLPASGPQKTSPPQPLETAPQFIVEGHAAAGMHVAAPPHTLGTPPPPHVVGEGHVPQSFVLPHPSLTGPHGIPPSTPASASSAAHAVVWATGVHALRPPSMTPPSGRRSSAPQVLGSPPPPQVVPVGHATP
jgi:hypothetical protein